MKETPERQKEINVRVLFFGAARDATGEGEVDLKLQSPTSSVAAFGQIIEAFPNLRRFGPSLLLAVNQEYVSKTDDREVRDGDELAIFPPVSGGANFEKSYDFFELTTDPIDVGAVARRVVLPECGATVTLDGYAREWTNGRRTIQLVYEAYPPMALRELEKLGAEARRRFSVAHIGIVHRIGSLEMGETSVVIAVSAPHRHAAFEACEWAIKELKRTVPIWKKEIFEDGEAWVQGQGGLDQ